MSQSQSARILVFGLDADLELTRKLLLNHAGYVVDAAHDWADYQELLMSDCCNYRLAILCHTLADDDRKVGATLARERTAAVLNLNGSVPPDEFVRRVSEPAPL